MAKRDEANLSFAFFDEKVEALPAIDERGYPPEWDDIVATDADLAQECGGLVDGGES
jgi:hypothetical protein